MHLLSTPPARKLKAKPDFGGSLTVKITQKKSQVIQFTYVNDKILRFLADQSDQLDQKITPCS